MDSAAMDRHTNPFDPITLALVQNRLDQIAQQMGWVMIRTSRSPIFNQSHDFSCFLTDAEGTLVSQADGIPIHTGGGGFAVRALLARVRGPYRRERRLPAERPLRGGRQSPARLGGGAAGLCRRHAGRLRLQPRPPVRHRRRRGGHLQSAGDRDLPRGHPPAAAEAGGAGRDARRPVAAPAAQLALPRSRSTATCGPCSAPRDRR